VNATARPDLILLPFVSWCGDAAIGELLFVTGYGGAVGAPGGAGHLVAGARGVGGHREEQATLSMDMEEQGEHREEQTTWSSEHEEWGSIGKTRGCRECAMA
jgi:hypothetical protein